MKVCRHETDTEACGASLAVREYLVGPRCPDHTPARLHDRPEDAPDPALTLEGMLARTDYQPGSKAMPYGTSRTDPLGRDGPGWRTSKQTGLPQKIKAATDD